VRYNNTGNCAPSVAIKNFDVRAAVDLVCFEYSYHGAAVRSALRVIWWQNYHDALRVKRSHFLLVFIMGIVSLINILCLLSLYIRMN